MSIGFMEDRGDEAPIVHYGPGIKASTTFCRRYTKHMDPDAITLMEAYIESGPDPERCRRCTRDAMASRWDGSAP